MRLSDALVAAGAGDEAGRVLDEALRSSPGNCELLWTQGNVRYNSGWYAEAAEAYRAALTGRPDDPPLLWNLSLSLRQAERADEAVAAAVPHVPGRRGPLPPQRLGDGA